MNSTSLLNKYLIHFLFCFVFLWFILDVHERIKSGDFHHLTSAIQVT